MKTLASPSRDSWIQGAWGCEMTGRRRKYVHRRCWMHLISADVTCAELRAVALRHIDLGQDFNFKITPSKVSPWLQSL